MNSSILSVTDSKNCNKNLLQNENISVFSNPSFGSVRTTQLNDKILFCGSDVAKILGYSNPSKALKDHCKGVTKRYTLTNGGTQELSFIPEGDVYRLIARSKLESAQKFESWVFDEVLPAIRKNGGYIAGQENLSPEELISNALVVANKILADRELRIKQQEKEIQEKTQVIEVMQPKADFFDEFENSNTCEEIGHIGKILAERVDSKKFGSLKIFLVLVDDKVIQRKKTSQDVYYYESYERYTEWFKTVDQLFVKNETTCLRPKLMVTPKGHIGILRKYSKLTKQEITGTYEPAKEQELNFGDDK